VDFKGDKRVLVWQPGREGSDTLVVVTANFSGFQTINPLSPSSEYVIPNYPATPPGKAMARNHSE
jgi:hypothetical protein